MAKYMCQCGMYLKPVHYKKDHKPKGNIKFGSYKVFIVKTETHYKCPHGCELERVTTYK